MVQLGGRMQNGHFGLRSLQTRPDAGCMRRAAYLIKVGRCQLLCLARHWKRQGLWHSSIWVAYSLHGSRDNCEALSYSNAPGQILHGL